MSHLGLSRTLEFQHGPESGNVLIEELAGYLPPDADVEHPSGRVAR